MTVTAPLGLAPEARMPKKFLSLLVLAITWILAAATPAHAATLVVQVRDSQGAPLPDAVVSLYPEGRPAPPARNATARMDQRNLSFSPQLLVVQTGTRVTFPNSDNVRHQVYSFSPAKPFELKLYAGNNASTEVFDRPGVVTLGCNIHDWMLGYIYVVDTPWFASSGGDGTIRLRDVPAGNYTLRLWQPRLAGGGPGMSAPVALGATPVTRSYVLTLHPPERTNKPPPGLEMGLGDRMEGPHAH